MKSLTWLILLTSVTTLAQVDKKSVVIGSMVSKPNALLVLNPINNDQGFLLPQLTSSQRIDLKPESPEEDGLIVFDSTEKSFYYWKEGVWVKGLDDDLSPVISFDPLTQLLWVDGSSVDLSTLKELPDVAGAPNRFLFSDGTSVSWKAIPAAGDITAVAAGPGLSGGATAGDAVLSVQMDNTSITVNGSNELTLADHGIAPVKLQAGTANTMLITNGLGDVNWINIPGDSDAQNLTLTGNVLSVTNDATPVDLSTISLSGSNIIDNTIGNADLANNVITTSKMLPGGNNTVLTTDASGVVGWTAPTPDAQDLTLTGNVLSVTNDATPVDLSTISLSGSNIIDNTIGNADLANNVITTAKMLPGGNNTVLTTDASGVVGWTAPTPDAQDLTLTGNVLSVTNDATPVDLSTISLSGSNIIDNTIGNADLANNVITTTKMLPGGNNTVLTTDASGVVGWTAPTPDAQDLTLTGNVLNLTNDATPIDLNNLSAGGAVSGPLNNLSIVANSIATAHVQNNSVTVAKLTTSGIVDATKVYTTNAAGVPQLETKSTFLNGIAAGGDLGGTYPSPAVVKLQGNAISPGTLAAADNGKVLIWNGTQWTPQVVPGISAGSKYLMIDPSDFGNLRKSDKKDKDNMVIFDDNSTYVTINKGDEGAYIIAPVHIPDGAVIQQITLFYMDRDANNLDFNFYRKTATGPNDNITNGWSSTGNTGTIQSAVHSPIAGRDVVDNNVYSYRIIVRLNPSGDTNDSSDATHRIYAVKIRYQ